MAPKRLGRPYVYWFGWTQWDREPGFILLKEYVVVLWRSREFLFSKGQWCAGNIFRITGPLYGEFTGHRWVPLTRSSDAELCFFSLICAWINSGENNREVDHLRRHLANYDVIVMGSCHDPNIFVTGGTRSCCTWLWQPMVPSLLVNVTFWWHVDEYRHATLYFLSHCIWPNWVLWKYWRIYELMASQYTANLGVAGQTDAKGGTLPISSVSVHTYCLSNKKK